jgi:beta-glucosidase
MKHLLTFFTVFSSTVSFCEIDAVTPQTNTTPWRVGWWMPRHEEKMKKVASGGSKVVFIGDSITHYWEEAGREPYSHYQQPAIDVLNLGFSGDRTGHVIWRITQGGELDGYKAKCIVLMIGTNNTGHKPFSAEPPVDTILGVRRILDIIREKQPEAKVVLFSIFPRGEGKINSSKLYSITARNAVVNKEIMKFADGKKVFWCDISDKFLTADGRLSPEVFPDLLHPNRLGYEIWHSHIYPYVMCALAEDGQCRCVNRYASNMFAFGSYHIGTRDDIYPVSRIGSVEGGQKDWYLERILEKRNHIVSSKGEFDAVLVGDSITHRWEQNGRDVFKKLTDKYSILNLGYGGDLAENVLWRLSYGELEGYKAKNFIILIGTNNLGGRRDLSEKTIKTIESIVELVRSKHKESKISVISLLPREHNVFSPVRKRIVKVNDRLKKIAGDKFKFIDVHDTFLNEDGSLKNYILKSDAVHVSAYGYEKVLLPVVQEIIEKR